MYMYEEGMPRHYNNRKFTKRKRGRKRAYNRVPRNYIGYASGMPKTRRAKLRYTTVSNHTGALATMVNTQFRANGCHDPEVAVGGHQPMAWDNWKALYNHYVVVGSKITVKVSAQHNAARTPTVVGLYLADDSTIPYTSYDGLIESRKGTYTFVQIAQDTVQTLTNTFGAKKFFNLTDVKDNVQRIGTTTEADPTEQAIYYIYSQSIGMAGTSLDLNIIVTVDYIVDFSEPKDLAQS